MEEKGHAERCTKVVTVRKTQPRQAWTNRSTKTVEKWCTKHEKICVFSEKGQVCKETRREQYIRRMEKNKERQLPSKKICRECGNEKAPDSFYKDSMCKDGLSNICKTCKKTYDRKRNDTWDVLIRMQWRYSLRAHGNVDEENSTTLKECKKMLKDQNYKCNHCGVELNSIQGNIINCSWHRASLDRIDTNIVGYGNNSQWLCVSCNKGKCTMPDEIHKEKFSKRDEEIDELKAEIKKLKKKLKKCKIE